MERTAMVKSMSLRERWSARGRASTVRNGEPAQQRGERASRDAVRACSAVGQADNAKPEEEEWAYGAGYRRSDSGRCVSSRLVEGVGAELVKQHSCAGSWSGAGAVKEADAALMGETNRGRFVP